MTLTRFIKTCLLVLVVITILSSCKKTIKEDEQQQPDITEYKLINTGYVFDVHKQQSRPYYWINEKAYALPLPKNVQHGISGGIESWNQSIYIAGGFEPTDGLYTTLPCYWKNNELFNLPTSSITQPFLNCFAVDIKQWNNNLYILGMADLSPVLWVVSPSGNIETSIIAPGVLCRTASNLEIHNNELYIGGVQKKEDSPNQFSFHIGYWIYNTSNKAIRWHLVEQRPAEATVFSISVSDKGFFMAGEAAAIPGEPPSPSLWKNGSQVSLQSINKNAIRLNEIHMDEGGKLHANILNIETYAPLIWKIDQHNNIQTTTPFSIPANTKGFCMSIAIEKNNHAYIGDYIGADGYHFWVVANGKQYELNLPDRFNPSLGRAKWVKIKE